MPEASSVLISTPSRPRVLTMRPSLQEQVADGHGLIEDPAAIVAQVENQSTHLSLGEPGQGVVPARRPYSRRSS